MSDRVHYISPSLFPSRSANSIHVLRMVEACANLGYEVLLFGGSTFVLNDNQKANIEEYYGVDLDNVELSLVREIRKGLELRIALHACYKLVIARILGRYPEIVFSRNLYAAFLLSLFGRRNMYYETHTPERGFRKILQAFIIKSRNARTIVISDALNRAIRRSIDIDPQIEILVSHDAAPAHLKSPSIAEKNAVQSEIRVTVGWRKDGKIVGYFGHLYAGRGLEIIQGLSEANPETLFCIFGGNEPDIQKNREDFSQKNVYFGGFVSHKSALKYMGAMDVLLMPYQESVSIGIAGSDTSSWMSPLKMFEYMASGTPIISSDLPVLREVLVNNRNALMVDNSDCASWDIALKQLLEDSHGSEALADKAYNDYKQTYNWNSRVAAIFNWGEAVEPEKAGGC